jgi:hypothetical protein
MSKVTVVPLVFVIFALTLLAGCGGSAAPDPPAPPAPAPLSAGNLNLIFVVSEDLAYHALGDINPRTANLTDQGLQQSLRMASFLQQDVLRGENVSAIYAVVPTTHPQTANKYPDMVGLEPIEQFAMLNQITLSQVGDSPVPANSYPVNSVVFGSAPPGWSRSAIHNLPDDWNWTYVQLPGSRFQRPGRRQRNPGKWNRHSKRAGLLCFFRAVGNG